MSEIEQIIINLTSTLKDQHVEKIILFGSFANGNPSKDSDLDVMVVTADTFIPSSNRQKMELHHKYNRKIRNFRKLIPIDLLVYTRSMFQKMVDSRSLFSEEILKKGKVIYEATISGLA
jgi:uncharacterized protein